MTISINVTVTIAKYIAVIQFTWWSNTIDLWVVVPFQELCDEEIVQMGFRIPLLSKSISSAYWHCCYTVSNPPPLPPVDHVWDLMWVWRKVNNEDNCVAAVLCTIYNAAQRYKQFLQVSRLYQALMLLFLPQSFKHLCIPDFMELYMYLQNWGYVLFFTF